MEDLFVITPQEIVEHFYYHKFNKKVAKTFKINKSSLEIKENKTLKVMTEIDFQIKKSFILKVNNENFLIDKNEYKAIWNLYNSFVTFEGQKPNFEFEIIKNNQTDYFNIYIDYFITTDFKSRNYKNKKFINVVIEKKNLKKRTFKVKIKRS